MALAIKHKDVEFGVGDTVKVYQAGSRVPVLLCSAGELEDLTGEGLALGLDSGPVFEKGLRSNAIEMVSGMRIVVVNDANKIIKTEPSKVKNKLQKRPSRSDIEGSTNF